MNEPRTILVAANLGLCIRSLADISEALSACVGADGLILAESDLGGDFFDLSTGLAGELFQKFTNYRLRLALVVQDPSVRGKRFAELAYEHTSHNLIRFFGSQDEALLWLHTWSLESARASRRALRA